MPDSAHRVRLEGVDFLTAFPTLRLFDSFRMALQPTKLLLGLLMLLLIYFGGVGLDFIWGEQEGPSNSSYYIFESTLNLELAYFSQLITAAVSLDLGIGALSASSDFEAGRLGVIGALRGMVIDVPAGVWEQHPWFFVLLVSHVGLVLMLMGGSIARLAATQACAGTTVGLFETARFTLPRAAWFIVSPLISLFIAGVIWLLLAVVGVVLFNVPGLNVVGGLLFGLMLFVGFIAACCVIFAALGAGMLPSALAVEGTDAFDVVSRVFTFLLYRPIRYLLLTVVMMVYGALTYLVVGTVVFFTLWFARSATGVWVGGFDELLPVPQLGQPLGDLNTSGLSSTEKATSWLIRVWSALLFGVSIAYAASYFFTAQTWLYLLLRRDVDGTAFEEYAEEPDSQVTFVPSDAQATEKVEPAAKVGMESEVESSAGNDADADS
ncbi:MAG: hypothetical protein AAGH99_01980 [Planctomycetota bacterium]